MLRKVQGRIGCVNKDLVHQHKRIPLENQENIIQGKKIGEGSFQKLSVKFSNRGTIKRLTIILRLTAWMLELKMTVRMKEQ